MPTAAFLAQLGMFVIPEFLDPGACASIRGEMQAAPTDAARILNDEYRLSVDSSMRRTEIAQVSSETRALVNARLMAIRPALEKHFAVELERCEDPSFLVYKKGFYYGVHVDANPSPGAPARFQERRVSISIFLNGEGKDGDPSTYSGGSLAFHGSQEGRQTTRPGVALKGEPGLLIGFPSYWPHEIQPVQRGVRYSVVTWFA